MRFLNKVAASVVGLNIGLFTTNTFAQEYQYPVYNMHKGVTPISHQIYDLHMIIFAICVVIGIVVFGALFYSLIRHRKSRGAKPSDFHEHPILEAAWAIIPLLILVGMAIPATIVNIRMYNTDNSNITIKVTGYQWKWKYDYLDQGISFFSNLSTPFDQIYNKAPKGEWYLLEVDKPLVVPIKQKIRFLITSTDVIHSWWVPALGVKKDAIPGFIHEAWAYIEKPGVYRGQCAELCGMFHGFMPIVVEAKTPADFAKWVQQQTVAQAPVTTKMDFANLMKIGESAYNKYCAACHQINGLGVPHVFPGLKASSIVIGKEVSNHIDLVLHGVPGTAMQAFGPQLTDVELAAIITYERNAWGNNTGNIVQPSDIQIERARVQDPKVAATIKHHPY